MQNRLQEALCWAILVIMFAGLWAVHVPPLPGERYEFRYE